MSIGVDGARVVRAGERGRTDLGWLDSRHSFSFGEYHDPARMGFGVLRVLNDDIVAPSGGFGEHGHRDMEIISLVLDGALEHRDSAGHHEVLRRGDVQVMSAGAGIRHSEKNASQTEPVRFLQIWIEPNQAGHTPRHERLDAGDRSKDGWFEIASGAPGGEGLRINQDATVAVVDLGAGSSIGVTVPPARLGYLHVASGQAECGAVRLLEGDAIEINKAASLTLEAIEPTTLVRFDLPPVSPGA